MIEEIVKAIFDEVTLIHKVDTRIQFNIPLLTFVFAYLLTSYVYLNVYRLWMGTGPAVAAIVQQLLPNRQCLGWTRHRPISSAFFRSL